MFAPSTSDEVGSLNDGKDPGQPMLLGGQREGKR